MRVWRWPLTFLRYAEYIICLVQTENWYTYDINKVDARINQLKFNISLTMPTSDIFLKK